MRRLWLTLALVFLPTLMCEAAWPSFDNSSNTQIPQNLLKNNDLPKVQNNGPLEVRYGFSSLVFNEGPLKTVKLDHRSRPQGGLFSLEKTAEAETLPRNLTISDMLRIANAITEANEINDLRSVLSPKYLQMLDEKIKSGVSQYVVLAMMQAMRPYNIHVLDFKVEDMTVILAVRGRSYYGPVEGLIELVKNGEVWTIDRESWFAGERNTKDYIAASLNPIQTKNKFFTEENSGLMSQISPDSRINHNILALSRAPYNKNGKSINFVFMLKKAKTPSDRSPQIYDDGYEGDITKHSRPPMHVLWTGSRRLMPEQKIVDQSSPVDFSIADYDDGYAPGQWNFIMPTKKPREVTISLLMNF